MSNCLASVVCRILVTFCEPGIFYTVCDGTVLRILCKFLDGPWSNEVPTYSTAGSSNNLSIPDHRGADELISFQNNMIKI